MGLLKLYKKRDN